MIELVSDERCTACNICVRVCPMNVFDIVPGAAPRVARQDDCQTCFMCELYCPQDALYVSPDPAVPQRAGERDLVEAHVLGSYRAAVGWSKSARHLRGVDDSFRVLPTT
jgi:NAD-dependent dihydropyrimidine dehydrogenase PreA subunit